MLDPTIATAVLIISLSIFLIVIIFTVLYVRLNRKLVLQITENEALKRGPEEQKAKVLDSAQAEAKRIIESAQKEAQKLMSESKFFSNDLTKNITESTTKALAEEDQIYQNTLNQIKSLGQRSISEASQKLTQESIAELNALKNQLANEFHTEYQTVRASLEEYKKQQMDLIAKEVKGDLDKIIIKALGHSLEKRDYEELIKKAIAEIGHNYG